MTTQRLFVAIDLPTAVKTQLMRLQKDLVGAKWVNREQLHLTLRFIGETSPEQLKELETGLAAIKAAPFLFQLSGVGQFPPKGKARVLWVGLPHVDALFHLQTKVEQVVTNCGFEPADHPFSPHITLARFRTSPAVAEIAAYFRQHSTFKSDVIQVNQFILYASDLTSTGSIYTQLARFPLA